MSIVFLGSGGYLNNANYLEESPLGSGGYLEGPPSETGAIGAQIYGIITKDYYQGSQILQLITADDATGAQVIRTITADRFFGAQMESVRQVLTGAEVRYAIYNRTQIRFMCDFPSRGVTGNNWTASSVQTGDWSPNNLNNDIVENAYRSADGVLSITLVCDTEIPQGVFLDTLAILEHNLSRGATVIVQGSNDPGFGSIPVIFGLEYSIRDMYYIAPVLPLAGYRYWRFVIDDSGNPDGHIRIGSLVFGSSQVFSNECNTDQINFGRRQFTDKVFTEGHTNAQNDRGKKRYVGLQFRSLNAGGRNYALLQDMFETYGTTHKCLWIPVPKDPGRFAVFGKLADLPQQTHNYKGEDDDLVDLNLDIDESL